MIDYIQIITGWVLASNGPDSVLSKTGVWNLQIFICMK